MTRTGHFSYCEAVHFASGRLDGPLCGAYSVMGWSLHGNTVEGEVTCKSCIRIQRARNKCVDCGIGIEDGYKTLCPRCHGFAAHGSSNRAIELKERFYKENVQSQEKKEKV